MRDVIFIVSKMSKTLVITVFIVLIILSLVRTQNVTVYPADSFADSIGVNTHWAYPNVYINNYTIVLALKQIL